MPGQPFFEGGWGGHITRSAVLLEHASQTVVEIDSSLVHASQGLATALEAFAEELLGLLNLPGFLQQDSHLMHTFQCIWVTSPHLLTSPLQCLAAELLCLTQLALLVQGTSQRVHGTQAVRMRRSQLLKRLLKLPA